MRVQRTNHKTRISNHDKVMDKHHVLSYIAQPLIIKAQTTMKTYELKFTWKGDKNNYTKVSVKANNPDDAKKQIMSGYPEARITACMQTK